MRKSSIFFSFFLLNGVALFFFVVAHPVISMPYYRMASEENRRIARELQVTDLCLFTEARYTRHLSQADLHAAFQDFPMCLEHFPSGSVAAPPEHLRAWRVRHQIRSEK